VDLRLEIKSKIFQIRKTSDSIAEIIQAFVCIVLAVKFQSMICELRNGCQGLNGFNIRFINIVDFFIANTLYFPNFHSSHFQFFSLSALKSSIHSSCSLNPYCT